MKQLLTFLLLGLLLSPANAQRNGEPSSGPGREFWLATVPGGEYLVALDQISSVSQASYLLDGGLVVTEVTVDTSGNSLARFYFIEPVSPEALDAVAKSLQQARDLIDKAAKTAGFDQQNMVQKKYPVTTHAKTVEFRLLSREALTGLYASIKRSYTSGRGGRYTVSQED